MKKWFIRIFIILYVIPAIIAYFVQHKLILNPQKIEESREFRKGEEVEVPLTNTLSMNCLHIKESNPPKGVVLYFHGNKGNARRAIRQTRPVQELGYDVFIPDYRGYGKTEGSLWSDKELLADADKAYKFLAKEYKEENIYVMGYSLGTGMASYTAALNNPKHLILVAPFTSLTDIKDKYAWFYPDFLMRFQLPNIKFLKDVKAPVTIVHGTEDNIIDYAFSEELKSTFPDKIKLLASKGQSHRGIIFDQLLVKELRALLN